MYKPRSIQSSMSFKDKLLSLDYVLIFAILILGIEIGARYTFSDNLDGSFPKSDAGVPNGNEFGNINNNDWYVFTGLTISFTFGDLPCYCKEWLW